MINILIVHEYRLMGHIIASVLEGGQDLHVAGVASTPRSAFEQVRTKVVDIVLVSARLPDQGALKLTRRLLKAGQAVKIIALGLSEEKRTILEYVEAGVDGYILRENSLEELITTIHAVQANQAIVSPEIASALIERIATLARAFEDIGLNLPEEANLTDREREVLELVNQGLTNRDIAERLVIEVGTVKTHVHSILEKLGVNTREEAGAWLSLMDQRREPGA